MEGPKDCHVIPKVPVNAMLACHMDYGLWIMDYVGINKITLQTWGINAHKIGLRVKPSIIDKL